ncbi:MAG TPA: hypothetical protein EYQ61_04640 [Dehalococcoidia bacterium]|nr:hypothetical protein [Dehalococcoidia bacterium]HIK88974.1 hypothetical protein [Dehalococcoidia bacterium]
MQAAHGIGRFGGTFITDLPEESEWMGHDVVLKRWGVDEIRHFPKPSKLDGTEPLLLDYLSGKAANDYQKLVNGLDRLRPAVADGTRTICHGDFHPRNVFVGSTPPSEPDVVAIDWSGVGLGPLETDIGTMVGSSLT